MKKIILVILTSVLCFQACAQSCVTDCGANVTLTAASSNPPDVCTWTGPNGFTATGCVIVLNDICFEDTGDYIATITDDCGNVGNETSTVNVQFPNALIFENSSNGNCAMFGIIQNCDNPNYRWIAPSGAITTGTLNINPVPVDECGLWTLEVIDCDGCVTCVDVFTWTFDAVQCCEEPVDCFASMNITKMNCDLTANVSSCDELPPSGMTPTYLWSTGATTQTISVSANGTYSVTVTGCCEDPMVDSYVVTDCEPPPACDCSIVAVADDANCEIDITASGPDCANYTMAVLKYGSTNGSCTQGNCSLWSGAPATTSIDVSGGCTGNFNAHADYKVILIPDSGSGCTFQETCVTVDCFECEVTSNFDSSPSMSISCLGGATPEILLSFDNVTPFKFDVPDCCGYAGVDIIGTAQTQAIVEVNGVQVSNTSASNNIWVGLEGPNIGSLDPTTGPAYNKFLCSDMEVGDIIEISVFQTNISIVGCDYSGPSSASSYTSYTLTADDMQCCVNCAIPAIALPSTSVPEDIALICSAATFTFCEEAPLLWSSVFNPNDVFVYANNTACTDSELVLSAEGPSGVLVTIEQALQDIQDEVNSIDANCDITITYDAVNQEIVFTGEGVNCAGIVSFSFTTIEVTNDVTCAITNNGNIDYDTSPFCCP